MKLPWRLILVMAALSVSISVVMMLIVVDDLSAIHWRVIAWRLLVGSTFGMCIGAVSWGVMSYIAHPVWQLHPVPRWAILLSTFAVCGAAGSFLAVLIVGGSRHFGRRARRAIRRIDRFRRVRCL